MGLITKIVKIKWTHKMKKYYEDKGYKFTEWNDSFKVKVEDLLKGSEVQVKVRCDDCNRFLYIKWSDYIKYKKNNKYYCNKCANKIKDRKRVSYNEMLLNIKKQECSPNFKEKDWKGTRLNGSIIKYEFIDKNGHIFKTDYTSIKSGKKTICNECAKIQQCEKQKLTEYQYVTYVKNIKKEGIEILTPYLEYKNIKQLLRCKCVKCNMLFEMSLINLLKKNMHGCENISSGEKIALEMFEYNGIVYKYQRYIPEIKLRSDFEIKLKNKKIIHLEIDGDQHYVYPNEFYKTYEEFIKAKNKDIIKDNWYKNKGMINIHIRYNIGGHFNDDIVEILKQIINGKFGECLRTKENKDVKIKDIINNTISKKIIAYTLNGDFYKIYNSEQEAEKELKIDNSTISNCLYNFKNIKRAGDYIFKEYTNNYPLKIDKYINPLSKSIIIYKNNIIIDICDSINEVERKYRIAKSSLCRYLNNKGLNPGRKYNLNFKKNINNINL